MNNYKIVLSFTIDQINNDTGNFASKLHINDRLGKFQKKDAYILFKDHKPNFINKLQTRLINPSKTKLGKISKNIIQNIVTNVREASHSNLWRNSLETIEWFRGIKKTKVKLALYNLTSLTFIRPYLKKILIDSINYEKEYIDITNQQFDIILACRKTVLENNGTTCIKSGPMNFDVPMRGI